MKRDEAEEKRLEAELAHAEEKLSIVKKWTAHTEFLEAEELRRDKWIEYLEGQLTRAQKQLELAQEVIDLQSRQIGSGEEIEVLEELIAHLNSRKGGQNKGLAWIKPALVELLKGDYPDATARELFDLLCDREPVVGGRKLVGCVDQSSGKMVLRDFTTGRQVTYEGFRRYVTEARKAAQK